MVIKNKIIVTLWSEDFYDAMTLTGLRLKAEGFGKHISTTQVRWINVFEGVLAEFAVAKALGVLDDKTWNPFSKIPDYVEDVGCIQVRASSQVNSHLILHSKDNPLMPFVFVRLLTPVVKSQANGMKFEMCGWIFGKEGKRKKYQRSTNGVTSYFIPECDLKSIDHDFDMLKSYVTLIKEA
jgi:hypothetical protein